MPTIDDILAVLNNQILPAMTPRPDLAFGGTPVDFSVVVRQDQPAGSGSSIYKMETVPMAVNTVLARLASGDIVATGSPILNAPTIADFTSGQHNHSGASTGGAISAAAIAALSINDLSDVSGVSAITGETGTGNLVRATDATLAGPTLNGVVLGGDIVRLASQTFYLGPAGATGVFDILNPNAGQVADINVDGRYHFRNGTSFKVTLSGTPTVDRVFTFPNVADDTVALLAATQTLLAKTLDLPTIADFTNAQHDHSDADDGGALAAAAVNTAGAVMHSDISAAEGFLRKTGSETYVAVKSNLGAAASPGATDDSVAGYSVGSLWINTTLDVVWQCVDSTATAAVWKDLSSAAGGGEANTASNVGTVGTGVFKQKTGVDLELYKINAADAKITVALSGTDRIDVGLGSVALADLSDVDSKSGTGAVVVMQGSPTLTTPTIASFVNAVHDHSGTAGGGSTLNGVTLDTASVLQNVFVPLGLYDGAGASWLGVDAIGLAVNYLRVGNASTGGKVTILTGGSDTNVDLAFYLKRTTDRQHLTLVGVASSVGFPQLTTCVEGGDVLLTALGGTNIGLNLVTTGTGIVKVNGIEAVRLSGAQTIIDKTLTSPTINGTIATTGLTVPALTLSGTLTRAADQTIDLTGAATRTLTVLNSTASQVCDLQVDGVLKFANGTAFTVALSGTPTGNRTATLPDATGTVALTSDLSSYVANALFDAQTILAAVSDNTPVAVSVAEERLVGRITGGNVAGLTQAQVRTFLGTLPVANGGTGLAYLPGCVLAISMKGFGASKAGDANGLSEVAETATNVRPYHYIAFDATTSESAFFEVGMPANYGGGTFKVTPVWSPATAATGGVVWGTKATSQGDNSTLDVAFGAEVLVTDTAQTAGAEHIAPQSAAITIGGSPAAGRIVTVAITRKTADASDTMTGDARLRGVFLEI